MIQRMKVRPLTIIEVRGDIVRKTCVDVVNVMARIETIEATISWDLLVQECFRKLQFGMGKKHMKWSSHEKELCRNGHVVHP